MDRSSVTSASCFFRLFDGRALLDVLVEEALVKIASDGVVDETFAHLRFVPSLVAEDDVVVPSTLGGERAVAREVQEGVAGRELVLALISGGSLLGGGFSACFLSAFGLDALELGQERGRVVVVCVRVRTTGSVSRSSRVVVFREGRSKSEKSRLRSHTHRRYRSHYHSRFHHRFHFRSRPRPRPPREARSARRRPPRPNAPTSPSSPHHHPRSRFHRASPSLEPPPPFPPVPDEGRALAARPRRPSTFSSRAS